MVYLIEFLSDRPLRTDFEVTGVMLFHKLMRKLNSETKKLLKPKKKKKK